MKDETFRIGPLMNLPALVRELGCDPDHVFANAGFQTSQFANPDFEASYIEGSRLLANCMTATGCEHLSLLLGERADPSSLGVPGFMLQTAPDVGAALRALVHHLVLHDRGATVSLFTHGRVSSFCYDIHLPGVEASEQIYDLAMVVFCKIMSTLCGKNWKPIEVQLTRPPPRDLTPYRHVFQAPLRFNAERNCAVFLTRWLDHQIASSNHLLHQYLEKEANHLPAQMNEEILSRVRRYLRDSLSTERCSAPGIARQLGMHERTFNRHLKAKGTTFLQELNNIRYDLAQKMLANEETPLSKISLRLGYSDTTAFSRAFKRWSGMTPTEWRTRQSDQ